MSFPPVIVFLHEINACSFSCPWHNRFQRPIKKGPSRVIGGSGLLVSNQHLCTCVGVVTVGWWSGVNLFCVFFVIHSSLAGTERIKVRNVWTMCESKNVVSCTVFAIEGHRITWQVLNINRACFLYTIYIVSHVYIYVIFQLPYLLLLKNDAIFCF